MHLTPAGLPSTNIKWNILLNFLPSRAGHLLYLPKGAVHEPCHFFWEGVGEDRNHAYPTWFYDGGCNGIIARDPQTRQGPVGYSFYLLKLPEASFIAITLGTPRDAQGGFCRHVYAGATGYIVQNNRNGRFA